MKTSKGIIINRLDDKRCYLPVKLEWECENCKAKQVKDFEDEYLSYPSFDKPINVVLYCSECDSDYTVDVNVKIEVLLSYEPKDIKKYE